ncbi:EEF1A lysine methyltransferase 2 isoform X2 [Trematomus bernacchii]|uniref:EEF1A lysine methyltransferase 2 isoform X2 n=1 Tax=Trematomus bernacchii TaxID=40690 RepID=UPI00146C1222|nr:EEF1A lysine methyltransferase 2 isoform X2 [Trematomus bernacchii]
MPLTQGTTDVRITILDLQYSERKSIGKRHTKENLRHSQTLGMLVRYGNPISSILAWFGEESMSRVLRWMDKAKIPEDSSVLDIGTGNGAFLVELAKHGYSNLTGIDYSPASVELSRNVLKAEDLTDVPVKEMDFLNCQGELKGFDVCIDKGTFDAISLNPDDSTDGKKLYVQTLKEAVKDKGFFVITSCNWTKEQLLERFSEGFEYVQELPTPSFQFGGKTGNSVTALIFKRVH